MTFRVIRDESAALTPDELKAHGNNLVTLARQAAVDAVRDSMHPVFLERGKSVTITDLHGWRHRAQSARDAWRKVDELVSELIREVEKTTELMNRGTKLVPQTEDGVHYTMVRVPDGAALSTGRGEK